MRVSNLEVSETLAESLLSLPMDEFMTEREVEEIAMIVKRSLA
jgi:dTDP-4-amino-4,6-dideoxygalactose transaminase